MKYFTENNKFPAIVSVNLNPSALQQFIIIRSCDNGAIAWWNATHTGIQTHRPTKRVKIYQWTEGIVI